MRAHHVFEGLIRLPVASDAEAETLAVLGAAVRKAVTFDMSAVHDELCVAHRDFGYEMLQREVFALPFPSTLFVWKSGAVSLATAAEDKLIVVGLVPHSDGAWAPVVTSRHEQGKTSCAWLGETYFEALPLDVVKKSAADMMAMTVAANVFLMSKDAETEVQPAPERLNKAREKKGRPPINEVRIVRPKPEARAVYADKEKLGTHASPMMHWRRGHFRTLHRGDARERVIPVAPALIGVSDQARAAIPAPKDYVVTP